MSSNKPIIPISTRFSQASLKKLPVIKELKRGGKSKYVQLLEGGIIRKKYDRNRPNHKEHFQHEVDILKYMAPSGYVPAIISVDPENFTIYMTYCGITPDDRPETYEKLAKLMKDARENWGLYRYEPTDEEQGFTNYVDKVELKNVCISDNKLYLIDFGSEKWVLRKDKIL